MSDKYDYVIDSIKKLLSLSVSDKEILDNLADVGLSRDEAVALLARAKGQGSSSVSSKQFSQVSAEKAVPEFEGSAGKLSISDQITRQLGFEDKSNKPDASSLQVDGLKVKDSPEKVFAPQKSSAKQSSSEQLYDKELDTLEEELLGSEPDDDESVEEVPEVKLDSDELLKKTPSMQKQKSKEFSSEFSFSDSQKSFSAKPIPKFSPKYSSSTDQSSDAEKESVFPDSNFEQLWKKGIVVAVNSKLNEMKQLKEEIDLIISEKVDSAVKRETAQMKVLMDSQKELIVSRNKEALEQKQKEITFIIDAKIAEIKQNNKQLADNIALIEQAKSGQQLSLEQIKSSLDEAKRTKSQLLIEVNSEMIKSKSKAQEFIDQAEKHIAQMDERINKTLELEKNIAEGMLQQVEQKIESLTVQKADELVNELQVELNTLRAIRAKLSPELIEQKIKVLDEFKVQFFDSMKQNLDQINSAIQQLNAKNEFAEEELRTKTLAIEAKLEELTKFEKQFTDKMEKKVKK